MTRGKPSVKLAGLRRTSSTTKNMKLNFWTLLMLLTITGCSHPPVQTAVWHRSISGVISEVNRDDYRFVLLSEDAVSGVTSVFQLKPDTGTRFQNAVGFRDLGKGDSVSVDFTQNAKGEFVPSRVILTKKAVEDESSQAESKGYALLE